MFHNSSIELFKYGFINSIIGKHDFKVVNGLGIHRTFQIIPDPNSAHFKSPFLIGDNLKIIILSLLGSNLMFLNIFFFAHRTFLAKNYLVAHWNNKKGQKSAVNRYFLMYFKIWLLHLKISRLVCIGTPDE